MKPNALLEQISAMKKDMASKPAIDLSTISPAEACLVIMDMVKGFVKSGALCSPRIARIVPAVAELYGACTRAGLPTIAFLDSHPADSVEFEAYPVHCLEGTEESELADELTGIPAKWQFRKNSTNGFLAPGFQTWLEENDAVWTFIVVGNCTDICVMQFVLTLKAHFDELNRRSRIIVPLNGIETFDLPGHDGDLMNLVALQLMQNAGIELVSAVDC